MKKRILLLALVVVLVVGMFIGGCAKPAPTTTTPAPATTTPATTPTTPTPAKVYEWKLQTFQTAASLKYKDVGYLTELIDKYTQGRIKITLYPVGAIVPAAEQFDACANNILQMINTVSSYSIGKIPVGAIEVTTPRLYPTAEDVFRLMWYRGIQDIFTEAYAQHGVHYLGFQNVRGLMLMTTKPVRTLADFKGMKVRTFGILGNYVERLGGSPVNIPMVETYMGLKLGTVEGAITGWDVHYDLKHYEVCKYVMLPWLSDWEMLNVSVNLNEWKSLPEDLKNILTLVTRDWSHFVVLTAEQDRLKPVMDTWRGAGVEFVQLPAEDSAKLTSVAWEMWDEWAKKDAYCAKAIGIIKEYQREQGYIK